MRQSFLRIFFCLFALVVTVIFLDRYFFDPKISHFGPTLVRGPASYIFSKLEDTRFFLRGFAHIKNLVSENNDLKKENLVLISKLAGYEETKEENNFLKSVLKIMPRFSNKVVYANIFQFQLGPEGYDVLINKGVDSGIFDGDIIITEENVLMGRIEKAHNNFSRALVVSDKNFSVAAKVLNSGAVGIAKGALAQGMYLDLIIQSDLVKEGDVVVSSGMDLIPPALIVGTVSYVETNEIDLFKKVKIRPALDEVKIGRVLIIKTGD